MSSVMLSPSPLGLGCVSVGFAYSLKICLTNVGTILERFKITMDSEAQNDTENKMKCVYTPQSLAPGMQMIIKVIFHAKENNHASFPISITRGSDKAVETHHITALVVPPDNFKKITRNLKFKNKDIYAEGVECIGAISLTQSSFIGEGAPSMYSENLISDDEFEVDSREAIRSMFQLYLKENCNDLSTFALHVYLLGSATDPFCEECVLQPLHQTSSAG